MIAFNRKSDSPYEMECVTVDVNQVCNQEKKFPSQWIIGNGTDISEEFLSYPLPLIQGEPERKWKMVFRYMHTSARKDFTTIIVLLYTMA